MCVLQRQECLDRSVLKRVGEVEGFAAKLNVSLTRGLEKDQVKIQVNMNQEDKDTFVFCLASKKTAARLSKEMADITTFCPERRAAAPDKHGISANTASNYSIMSEIPEVTVAMLDSKLSAVLSKYPDVIDSIHFSDQYTGLKPTDTEQAPGARVWYGGKPGGKGGRNKVDT